MVAHPTETTYGLGTQLTAAAIARVAALKGRPPNQPCVVLVGNAAMVETLELDFNERARTLCEAYWPGPLTLIVNSRLPDLPTGMRNADGAVALRWTSHPGMQMLLSQLNQPITSTSANLSGDPPATDVATLEQHFDAPIRDGTLLVLDAGPLPPQPPSSIVDCTCSTPRLVREGGVTLGDLRRVVSAIKR